MMSAGKAEISKLNTTMGETAKFVQELKAELHKRKSSCILHVSSSAGEVNLNSQPTSCKHIQIRLNKSSADNEGPNDLNIYSFPTIDNDECASSVLTEEPEPEVQEMDKLEAELESELQKLPWCTVDAPHQEGLKDLIEVCVFGFFYVCAVDFLPYYSEYFWFCHIHLTFRLESCSLNDFVGFCVNSGDM